MFQKEWDIDQDVSHIIKVSWLKCHYIFDVLYDPGVAHKLKRKFYRTAIRSLLLHAWSRMLATNM
jgi:hypothetical protein